MWLDELMSFSLARFCVLISLIISFCALSSQGAEPFASSTQNKLTNTSESPTQAAASKYPQDAGFFRFHLENDFFYKKDADYTNGVRLEWMAPSHSLDESWGWGPFGVKKTPEARGQWGLSLTQLMFTPQTKSANPIFTERPYAGHLAIGVGRFVKNEDMASSFELQIGMTGKPSLAKQAQYTVHEMLEMEQWPGWENQLKSEATVQFYYKQYYRLRFLEYHGDSGFSTDGMVYWHADAGTVYLRGGIGGMFRFGYNLPTDVNEVAIAGASFGTSLFVRDRILPSDWSVYGLIGGAGRAVGYDMFLDGGTFHSSPIKVHKKGLVGDLMWGVGVRYKTTECILGGFWRTNEYATQRGTHFMGAIQVRWTY